jgi:hypothetical protein
VNIAATLLMTVCSPLLVLSVENIAWMVSVLAGLFAVPMTRTPISLPFTCIWKPAAALPFDICTLPIEVKRDGAACIDGVIVWS